jgi:hypothetical protein
MTQAANLGALGTNAGTTGVLVSAGLPTGSVLQVVNARFSSNISTTSTTFIDTGLTATITPKFSTSKVLVIVNHQGIRKSTGNTSVGQRIMKNGSALINIGSIAGYTGNSNDIGIETSFQQYLDSPATTSATTYSTQYNTQQTGTVGINDFNNVGTSSSITLMEIAA